MNFIFEITTHHPIIFLIFILIFGVSCKYLILQSGKLYWGKIKDKHSKDKAFEKRTLFNPENLISEIKCEKSEKKYIAYLRKNYKQGNTVYLRGNSKYYVNSYAELTYTKFKDRLKNWDKHLVQIELKPYISDRL